MDNTLDSLSQPKISPARPMTLEERLMELLYGNEGLDYEAQKKLRLSEQHRAEAPVTGLDSQIPGANPEVPTGDDALVGALMSMGGVPPAIARSGSPQIQRPAAMRRPSDNRLLPEGGKIGDSIVAPSGGTQIKPAQQPARLAQVQDMDGSLRVAFHKGQSMSPGDLKAMVESQFPGHRASIVPIKSGLGYSREADIFHVSLFNRQTGFLDYKAATALQDSLGGQMSAERTP